MNSYNADKKKAVVSLGHDALGYTTEAQHDAVRVTAKALADLIEENYQLTIEYDRASPGPPGLYACPHVRLLRHEPGVCGL